jgi:hypothetical protein
MRKYNIAVSPTIINIISALKRNKYKMIEMIS